VEIAVIFSTFKLAKAIAEFSGLIKTVSSKIDLLADAEFEAGFRALKQASISTSEKTSLLREARNRFNKAISFEKKERLFLCHIGLAICHKGLRDRSNFKLSMESASKVDATNWVKTGTGLEEIDGYLTVGRDLSLMFMSAMSGKKVNPYAESSLLRARKIFEIQKNIKKYLSDISNDDSFSDMESDFSDMGMDD
jgi:hypothetical protein